MLARVQDEDVFVSKITWKDYDGNKEVMKQRNQTSTISSKWLSSLDLEI